MCTFISDNAMLGWLRHQSCIIAAWREELAGRTDTRIDAVVSIERHHDWLVSEIDRIEHSDDTQG